MLLAGRINLTNYKVYIFKIFNQILALSKALVMLILFSSHLLSTWSVLGSGGTKIKTNPGDEASICPQELRCCVC